MKKSITILVTLMFAFFFTTILSAQDSSQIKNQFRGKNKTKTQQKSKSHHGNGFVDENGDGYNDNAPDHDGDGIPNGLDEDYTGTKKNGFVDEDGDGINDNAGMGRGRNKGNRAKFGSNNSKMKGQTSGMHDGTGQGMGQKGRSAKRKGRGGN